MPYKRRYARRKRYYKKKYPVSSAINNSYGGYITTAMKALRIATHVASIVNSELLHYDEVNTLNPDSATGATSSLIRGMSQGDTNVNFHGNSILCKKLNLQIAFLLGAAATATRIRFLVVWDTRPSTTLATIPAWTDVMSAANTTAFMNIDDQLNRFRILADRNVVVNTNYPEKMVRINRAFSRHIKFTDAQVPNLNDIIVLAISDEATNVPTITVRSRIRFYDN